MSVLQKIADIEAEVSRIFVLEFYIIMIFFWILFLYMFLFLL